MLDQRPKSTATVVDLKPPPSEKVTIEKMQGKNGSLRRSPITATPYTVAVLQTATNSFSQENLVGEGSLGRVYRADFPNGKVGSHFLTFGFHWIILKKTVLTS